MPSSTAKEKFIGQLAEHKFLEGIYCMDIGNGHENIWLYIYLVIFGYSHISFLVKIKLQFFSCLPRFKTFNFTPYHNSEC
jgi:hypothetical protein